MRRVSQAICLLELEYLESNYNGNRSNYKRADAAGNGYP